MMQCFIWGQPVSAYTGKALMGNGPWRLNLLLISYSLCTKPPASTRSNFQHTNTFLSNFALLQFNTLFASFCSCYSRISLSLNEFQWVILMNVYHLLSQHFSYMSFFKPVQNYTKTASGKTGRYIFLFIIWNIKKSSTIKVS